MDYFLGYLLIVSGSVIGFATCCFLVIAKHDDIEGE